MNGSTVQPSQDTIQFLQTIEPEDLSLATFVDSLVTTSDTGKELGEFTVSIQYAKYKGEDAYLVHANSHGAIDNVPCGTSITAYVSPKLETLEQQHHEYVKLADHPLDRKTFIVIQDDKMVINKVVTQGEEVSRGAETFDLSTMKGFISEGSNLLLQRILVRKGLPTTLSFLSFDSETNLCTTTYKSLEERTETIGKEEVEVVGIERTIHSTADLPTTWQSYFLKDGHLCNRVQVGSPVTMKLLRMPRIMEKEEPSEKAVFEKKSLDINEDMQLFSMFLDRKDQLKNDHTMYMRHHPELQAILADFLQFLLLRKPEDIFPFAVDYFSSFSSQLPSHSPYAKSSEIPPKPQKVDTNLPPPPYP
ncbi:ciliogenesis-associated TTC17-interacting protein-like isoform X1 [Branchiostoma floridae x Branchiostoma japonicum]